MLTEFTPKITRLLQRLQQLPSLTLVDVLEPNLKVMYDAMQQYHLRPRDALHYEAMKRVECMNLASNDSDFDSIASLNRYTL